MSKKTGEQEKQEIMQSLAKNFALSAPLRELFHTLLSRILLSQTPSLAIASRKEMGKVSHAEPQSSQRKFLYKR
jgi:hypothetical protein